MPLSPINEMAIALSRTTERECRARDRNWQKIPTMFWFDSLDQLNEFKSFKVINVPTDDLVTAYAVVGELENVTELSVMDCVAEFPSSAYAELFAELLNKAFSKRATA